MVPWIQSLFNNIRFYVLIGTVLLSGGVYEWIISTTAQGSVQTIQLEEWYGFISVILLYITLLAGPLCYTFTFLPLRGQYMKARRSLGVSAFYFALLHFFITFFGQLGGFNGLNFFSIPYLTALTVGFIALFIFFLLAITSFDKVVRLMRFKNWKLLHRFVYLAALLTIIHVLMLGVHYTTLSNVIPLVSFIALAFLLLLEAPRLDKFINTFRPFPTFGIGFVLIITFLAVVFFTIIHPFIPSSRSVSFDIHAAHKQLATQRQQQRELLTNPNINLNTIPGLNGDRNKRYTVSFNNPPNAQPNQDITLKFSIYDSATGSYISLYRVLYAQPMHCIIVDNELKYFSHIHPTQESINGFTTTTQFPHTGFYHIYVQFQPFGGIEQQVGFVFPVGVGQDDVSQKATTPVDTNITKVFGNYEVTLDTHGGLNAQEMSVGNQKISFTIKDEKTKKPLATLKPYLASFGHLTMIREEDYDFVHVHPYSLVTPPPNSDGGPTVDFLPIGIYGPFKPGTYRIFAEFNPNDNIFISNFTVKVN